jgi:hypothetical protein
MDTDESFLIHVLPRSVPRRAMPALMFAGEMGRLSGLSRALTPSGGFVLQLDTPGFATGNKLGRYMIGDGVRVYNDLLDIAPGR